MKRNKGITLLISIITTALLLLVAYVVVNIATKQLMISYSNQESQFAFYDADSGMECAVYWDLKNATSAFATSTASTISCNNQSLSAASPAAPTIPPTATLIGGGGNALATSTFKVDFPKGCAIVQVYKANNGTTVVTSRGYNTCNTSAQRRFERGIKITY